MRIAGIKESLTDSERLSAVIYFQGCSRKCPGCHNPELQNAKGGFEISTDMMFISLNRFVDWVDDVVLQGGEPMEQQEAVIEIAQWAKEKGKSVWLFTGNLFGEVPENIKNVVDIIVDGPYVEEERNTKLKYRGSSNQKLYKKEEGVWVNWNLEE